MKRNTLLFIMLCLGINVQSQSHFDSLDFALDSIYQQSGLVGFGVAIVDENGALFEKGYGFSDLENKKPYTSSTIQNIASVSKTSIGLSIMKAVEEGMVDLDAPISTYLPYEIQNPFFPEEAITLRHLATHTATIFDREAIYQNKGYAKGTQQEFGLEAFLYNYFHSKGKWYKTSNFHNARPGTVFSYSNIGAGLAAFVLEKATGQRFNHYTRQLIFQPLKMESSGWYYGEIDMDRHSILYKNGEALDPYILETYPDGGLRSSVHDLALYLSAVIRHDVRILSEDSWKAMLEPQFGTYFPEVSGIVSNTNQGIFWEIGQTGRIGHTGGDPGVATVLLFSPFRKTGAILFTNTALDEKNGPQFKAIWEKVKDYPVK